MSTTPLQDQLLRDVPVVDGYKVLEPTVLVEKLPEGGMAAVYRGLHLDLKVDVAVKVLKRGAEATGYSPQAVARFRQEAEQAARLNDPNLVRIYDFPANKLGLLYLVMEYIDGETLESRVQRKGRLTPHETVTIAFHSARGLQAAHGEGVIHRDIKPPNILMSKKGQVKLTDLGIAKASDSAAMGMTQEITLLGTPQYMSPELWRGARFASAASDVYALGATIAFMLTGRHVLDGPDTQEIMHRTLTQGFPDIARLVPGVPPQLDNVIRLCTMQNPTERVPIDELIVMLRELLDLYRGELNLADPKAGSTMQTSNVPTRLPSRSDLARIREELDRIKIPTPPPGTLVMRRDRPGEAVAAAGYVPPAAAGPNAAIPGTQYIPGRGTVPPKTAAAGAAGRRPPTAMGTVPVTGGGAAPSGAVTRVNLYAGPGVRTSAGTRGRRKPSLGKRLVKGTLVLGVLGGAAAGGYLAVEKGWVKEFLAKMQAGTGGGATQPTTNPDSRPVAVVADNGGKPANPSGVTPDGTGPATKTGMPAVGPTDPKNPVDPKVLGDPKAFAAGMPKDPSADPGATTQPAEVVKGTPPATKSTDVAKVPDVVKVPESATKPSEIAKTPDVIKTPEVGKTPSNTKPPENGKTPENGKAPEVAKVPDPPRVDPAKAGGYDPIRQKALAAGQRRAWDELFPLLAGWREAADATSKRADYVQDVDEQLMAFRAGNPDLAARRREYPALTQQLALAVSAGSRAAALALAEAGMDVRQLGPGRRTVTPADRRVGLAEAVRNLELAADPGPTNRHALAAADASGYLPDAKLGQLDYLGTSQRWFDLLAWLDRMQVSSLRAAAASTPAAKEVLDRAVMAADRYLLAFHEANGGPDKVRAAARDPATNQGLDLAKLLGPYADAGSPAAALVAAESVLKVDPKTGLVGGVTATSADAAAALLARASDWLQQAKGAKDSAASEPAGRYLVGTYAAAALSATDRKAWGEAVGWLARARAVATAADAPEGAEKQWRLAAGEAVTALRAANPNLDERRKALPTLTQDLAPLAAANVFAAKLALAEQTIGYDGDPPKAAPRGLEDPTFAVARLQLTPCISSELCPPDVKREAVGREWDILATLARQLAESKPPPARLADSLGALAERAAIGGRQKEYDALVEDLLPADDSAAAKVRVGLAERQLDVGEDAVSGLRTVRQKDKRVVAAARSTLEGLRESKVVEVRVKACSLLGEIALLDGSAASQAKAYVLFKDALAATPGRSNRDPGALVGIGWFYRLPDERLAPLAAVEPALADLQKTPAAERSKQLIALYREAAFSRDPIANFVAGQYLWQFPASRTDAEKSLRAANEYGHKQANKELARLRNGGTR